MTIETSTKHEKYVEMARDASLRSNCAIKKVGAVLVRNGIVLSRGWNGIFSSRAANCIEAGCPRCALGESRATIPYEKCLCLHAEQYAIALAAKKGVSLCDSTLYCTLRPCIQCTLNLLCSGVIKVIYADNWKYEEPILESFHEKLRSDFTGFTSPTEDASNSTDK